MGKCQEVGLLTNTLGQRCNNVQCEPIAEKHCIRIVPPAACCPICSGALRIVFSRKQIDRALYALKGQNTDALTLRAILAALAELIRVSQCRLSGYLTIETDIFVTVQSTVKTPSFIQIEACTREVEKMSNLISMQSHRITSNLALSSLTVAHVIMSSNLNGTIRTEHTSLLWIVVFLNICIKLGQTTL